MTETTEFHYSLSSKGRLETIEEAIAEGLARGADATVIEDWSREAAVESARLAGETALSEGKETVVVDGLEVPSAYSALVRQLEGVRSEHVREIAGLFESERDFTNAMDQFMAGEGRDPRLDRLSVRWGEVLPRNDLHGLKEGSILETRF